MKGKRAKGEKPVSILLDFPFCNKTGSQCRHCSIENEIFMGGYCDLKTGVTVREKKLCNLGQMCNCESKWVCDLECCPLDECVSPDDTWEETIEKKPAEGQQVLL